MHSIAKYCMHVLQLLSECEVEGTPATVQKDLVRQSLRLADRKKAKKVSPRLQVVCRECKVTI
jgi:hypothetical protein